MREQFHRISRMTRVFNFIFQRLVLLYDYRMSLCFLPRLESGALATLPGSQWLHFIEAHDKAHFIAGVGRMPSNR